MKQPVRTRPPAADAAEPRGSVAKPRVVVALMTAGVAGREKLDGVIAGAAGRWNLSLYRSAAEFTAETVKREAANGAAGFIVGLLEAGGALEALARTSVPAVLVDVGSRALARRGGAFAVVRNDPAEIGRAAALELLACGPRASFGYVGWRRDELWSVERGKAFAAALPGRNVKFFDRHRYGDRTESPAAAASWLARLPKPCAVFAACDDKAWEILQLCREAGLLVPRDVAVLGVNDDAALCESASPRLSSVKPDFKGEGRRAATVLAGFIGSGSGPAPRRTVTVPIAGVSRRESTAMRTHGAELAAKSMAWLVANALAAPDVATAANAVHVSPSLLERRFRETFGESVYAASLRLRLEEVCRRLLETSDAVGAITEACGWSDPAPPKRLFRRRFGMSMSEFRRSGGAWPDGRSQDSSSPGK